MMGPSHATCGVAAWLLLSCSDVGESLGVGIGAHPAAAAAGALVAGGAALLPDADHHSASVSRSLPPVSRWICSLVAAVSGGHRGVTHSLFALVVTTVGAAALGHWIVDVPRVGPVQVGVVALAVYLISLALAAVGIARGPRSAWPLSLGAALWVGVNAPTSWAWFAAAVGLGYAVHLAGDLLTEAGEKILWPVVVHRPRSLARVPVVNDVWRAGGAVAIPLLGDSGSWREKALVAGLTGWTVWRVLVAVGVIAPA